MQPALIACSHGTSSPVGRASVAALVSAVAGRRPDLDVRSAFVDVEQPRATDLLAELAERPARLVPLLLSAGHHVYVDLTAAVAAHPNATLSATLGPDPRLTALLARRLEKAGLREDDTVILAAAGSSDPRAVEDCQQVAVELGHLIGRPVPAAYLSAAEPRLDAAVADAHESRSRVVVATYLLAAGFFSGLVSASRADVVTPPLLSPAEPPAPELVDLVLERYAE